MQQSRREVSHVKNLGYIKAYLSVASSLSILCSGNQCLWWLGERGAYLVGNNAGGIIDLAFRVGCIWQ